MFSIADLKTFIYGVRIENASPPLFLKFRSSNAFIIATIALAIFSDVLLYSIIIPILPFALEVRAGIPKNDVERWTSISLSIYGAALAIGSPIFGWIADHSSSRRLPLLMGLLALASATTMFCLGKSLPLMIMARFLQGISASMVWTVGLACMSDTIPEDEMGHAMGYVTAATSAGELVGPLLGGVVYAKAGFNALFAMGYAIIILDITMRLLMVEKRVAKQWDTTPSDPLDTNSSSDAIPRLDNQPPVDIEEGSLESRNPSIHKTEEQTPSNVETTLEKGWKSRLPAVFSFLTVPRIISGLLGCFVVSVGEAVFDSSLPLFVINTFGWDSSGAGLVFICLVVPSLLAPIVGKLSDRCGARSIAFTGFVLSVPFWLSLRFVTHNSIMQKVILCVLLTGIGIALALILTPLLADLESTCTQEGRRRPDNDEQGSAAQGFGLFTMAFALGTLLGPLTGLIYEGVGWGAMTMTVALLAAVTAVPIFIWTGRRLVRVNSNDGEA